MVVRIGARKGRRRQSSGFTLVEIIVAMSITLLGILSVGAVTSYSASVARQAEARSLALMIGRQAMEQIVSISQGNRRSITEEPIEIPADLKAQFSGKSNVANIEAVYSIRPVEGSKNLQNILVSVRWVNAASVNKDAKQSSTYLIRTVSSIENMETTAFDGWNPRGIDQYFYTPPPPAPPRPPTTNNNPRGSNTSTPGGSSNNPGNSSSSGNGGNSGNQGSTSGGNGTSQSSNGGGTSNTQNNTTTTWSPGTYGSKWQ